MQIYQKLLHPLKILLPALMLFQNEELQKYCEKFKITDEKEIEHLNYLLTATLNKILHKPFMNLKQYL